MSNARKRAEEALAEWGHMRHPALSTERLAEARLRLTCAALGGLLASPGSAPVVTLLAADAVACADACLALLYPEVTK